LDYRWYTMVDGNDRTAAQVLVPNTQGSIGSTTYYPTTEYWFNVMTSTPSSRLTVSWADYSWTDTPPTLGTQSFTMTQAPEWTTTGGAPQNSSDDFVSTTLMVALHWEITYSSRDGWGGHFAWRNTTGTNTVFGGETQSPQTLTDDTSPNPTWYTANV